MSWTIGPIPPTPLVPPAAGLVREIIDARRALRHGRWIERLRSLALARPDFTLDELGEIVRTAYGEEGTVLAVSIATRWTHLAPRSARDRAWIGNIVRHRVLERRHAPTTMLVGALSIDPHWSLWRRLAYPAPPFSLTPWVSLTAFSALHVAIARVPHEFRASIRDALSDFRCASLQAWRDEIDHWREWVEPCTCLDCADVASHARPADP